MAKLTRIEKKAYDALVDSKSDRVGIEELIEAVYGDYPPSSAKASMSTIMRSVIAKTESSQRPAIRVSGLGRGAKAVYALMWG